MTTLSKRLPAFLSASLITAMLSHSAFAAELSRYFSDDMVLQRDKPVNIFGTGKKGEEVTVTFAGQSVKATTDKHGRWTATLKPMKADSRGQTLRCQGPGDKELVVENVVIGDVFVCARQSSIDVSLGKTPEGQKAGSVIKGDKIRFIKIQASPSRKPLSDLKEGATKGWQALDKKNALTMTASAFHFGREVADVANVPIGIVDLSMGYHFPGAWLSEKGIEAALNISGQGADDLKLEVEYLPKDYAAWDNKDSGYYRDYINKHYRPQKTEGPMNGLSPMELPHTPSVCYNAVIHPLRGLTAKGMVLQLGNDYPYILHKRLQQLGLTADKKEVGVANKQHYKILKEGKRMTHQVMPLVVDDLRASLGDAALPVAWVVPPGSDKYDYASMNRDMREFQRRIVAKSKAIDLVLPGAEHIRMSGQPADEALVANRCYKWALAKFYGYMGASSGPVFESVTFAGNKGKVAFSESSAQGMKASGDALKHFEVAGEDRSFAPAKAEVDGRTVTISSDQVDAPKYVRYGWAHKPVQGLINNDGLPALPFNTDPEWVYNDWPDLAPSPVPAENAFGPEVARVLIKGHSHGEDPENMVTLIKDATILNHGQGPSKYPESEWHKWRLTAVESPDHIPAGWQEPDYDDSAWHDVIPPASWQSGHIGLLRTTWNVEDPEAFESLEVRSGIYKVRNFTVYFNGKMVGRVDFSPGRNFGAKLPLKPEAL